MGTTNWRKAATGDFAKKGEWDDGRPGIHADAVIAATGANYVVKVISADAAHTLTLNSANATLLEKVHGSLDVGLLDIEHGTAILTTANTIDSITMTGGELEFSNSTALGDAAISLSGGATLAATADVEISNDIMSARREESFAVKNGAVLKLDGGLTFSTLNGATLNFMGTGSHGKGDGTGVVDLDGSIGAMSTQSYNLLNITGVTLGTSIADNTAFDTFLSNMHLLKIASTGVLDLTGQNDVTLHNLGGTGELVNLGPRENLTLLNSSFGGTTEGDFDITLNGDGLGGTIALKSGDAIHVIFGAHFDEAHFIGDAPPIDLEDTGGGGGVLSFDGTTFGGAGPAVDLGTGQNNELDIDHTFTGTISNFGGHNGGTDHIIILDESGHGNSTLHYEPNEAGTGGELTVQFGTEPAFTLNLEGTYTQDDFTAVANGIACSAEQPASPVPDITHLMDALI